jgi:hypothetical protein
MAKHTSVNRLYTHSNPLVLPQCYKKVFTQISERVWQKIEKRLDKQEKTGKNTKSDRKF